MSNADLMHPLISEVHAELSARGWRPSDEILDLVNSMLARGGPLPARVVGPLSGHLRADNGIRVVDVVVALERAWTKAGQRALALVRASEAAARPRPALATDAESLLTLRVEIKDRAAWERLSIGAVTAYLAAHGWHRTAELPRLSEDGQPLAEYWTNGRGSELLIPREIAAGRTARLADIVHDLEQIEGRSQLLIYRDLLRASA